MSPEQPTILESVNSFSFCTSYIKEELTCIQQLHSPLLQSGRYLLVGLWTGDQGVHPCFKVADIYRLDCGQEIKEFIPASKWQISIGWIVDRRSRSSSLLQSGRHPIGWIVDRRSRSSSLLQSGRYLLVGLWTGDQGVHPCFKVADIYRLDCGQEIKEFILASKWQISIGWIVDRRSRSSSLLQSGRYLSVGLWTGDQGVHPFFKVADIYRLDCGQEIKEFILASKWQISIGWIVDRRSRSSSLLQSGRYLSVGLWTGDQGVHPCFKVADIYWLDCGQEIKEFILASKWQISIGWIVDRRSRSSSLLQSGRYLSVGLWTGDQGVHPCFKVADIYRLDCGQEIKEFILASKWQISIGWIVDRRSRSSSLLQSGRYLSVGLWTGDQGVHPCFKVADIYRLDCGQEIKEFILNNFVAVGRSDQFQHLPGEFLMEVLSSDCLVASTVALSVSSREIGTRELVQETAGIGNQR